MQQLNDIATGHYFEANDHVYRCCKHMTNGTVMVRRVGGAYDFMPAAAGVTPLGR